MVKLADEKGETREIELSDRAIDLILKAAKEKIYYKKNGEVIDDKRMRSYADLVNNDYVLRTNITRTTHFNESCNAATIVRRIALLKELFQIPYLTATNSAKSGMIKMAKDLIGDGEVTTDVYKKIAERFKVNNYYSLKTYITKENIERLYGN